MRWRQLPGADIERNLRALDRLLGRTADRLVTGTYSADDADDVLLVDTTSAAFTITLPSVEQLLRGKLFTIVKTNAGANNVTVQGTGGQTIDGAASVAFNAQYAPRRFRAVLLTTAPTYGWVSA